MKYPWKVRNISMRTAKLVVTKGAASAKETADRFQTIDRLTGKGMLTATGLAFIALACYAGADFATDLLGADIVTNLKTIELYALRLCAALFIGSFVVSEVARFHHRQALYEFIAMDDASHAMKSPSHLEWLLNVDLADKLGLRRLSFMPKKSTAPADPAALSSPKASMSQQS
jgi:hypothetical protein